MKILSKIFSVKTNKLEKKKIAMAVPSPSGELAEQWKQQGIHLLQNMLTRMPQATQKETMEAIVGSGASEFFKDMTPRTVISLPSIYVLDPDDIFEIDGKQYVSIYVEPPRKVGQKWTAPSGLDSTGNPGQYIKGQDFKGEVVALDLNSGMPTVLPLEPIKDKVIAPTGDRNAVLSRANKEIEKYNERIKALNEATGADKLVLQIARAKDQINNRLTSLDRIKMYTEEKLAKFKGTPLDTFESWANNIREEIYSGRMSLKDAYDTILYLYMSTPEKLIQDIESGTISIPEELKAGILAIARKEVEVGALKAKDEERKSLEQKQRIEDKAIPDIHDSEIEPFVLEDIPGASVPGKEKYKSIQTNKSMWSMVASLKNSLNGTIKDIEELTQIKQTIDNMEKYMGGLQKGQRSTRYLNTPEGKPILDAMNEFLSKSSLFIKRYAIDIIQDGKVNPKLMGSRGTEGNALLAVSLTRMYNVVKETISKYSGGADDVAPEKELTQQPVEAPELRPASSKNKIQKMSELLWKAFEERMSQK